MKKYLILVLAFACFSSQAFANWTLVNDESALNFVSIKKSSVGEVHHFKQLKGSLDTNGAVSVEIDLSSVETNIGIRNERMKSMLFEVSNFAKATVTAPVDIKKIKALAAGETYTQSVDMVITVRGAAQTLASEVRVVKLAGNKLLATTAKPIMINAKQFGLVAGVEKLREVANLPSIATAVPVSFSLVFSK